MTCAYPITLKNGLEVPCGSCTPCRIKRSREWTMRLMHENKYHRASTFLTLTYNDEHVPYQIDKEELRSYIKRLRRYIEPATFRYYACGEYGEENGRPHYHAIIFGMHPEADKELFAKAWLTYPSKHGWLKGESPTERGFIYTGTVTEDSCRYVADYVCKTILDELWEDIKDGKKNIPFSLKSGGLGKRYCMENAEKLSQTLTANFRGKEVALPRYYVNKLEIDKERLEEKTKESKEREEQKLIKKGLAPFTNAARAYKILQGKNRENIADHKIHLAKKGVRKWKEST